MSQGDNPWRTLDSRSVYDTPWIGVREDRAISPGGVEVRYGVVGFKKMAIGVVPLEDDGRVHLVGQWRYPLETFTWELPEGGGEPGAEPVEEARRELREESGLRAANWRPILKLHTSNSVTDEFGIIFLATGLERAGDPEPEHTEHGMQQICIPFPELMARIVQGEITDSLTVAGALRIHHMAAQGEFEPSLAEAILGGAP